MSEISTQTVALLGPPKAGTTSLLASLGAGFARRGHGFPADWILRVEETDPQFGLSRLARDFKLGAVNTHALTQNVSEYHIDLVLDKPPKRRWLSFARTTEARERRVSLRIVDVPGDILLALADSRGAGNAALSNHRKKVELAIAEASALVIVWPITRVADQDHHGTESGSGTWIDALRFQMPELLKNKLTDVIVAFSQYDLALAPAFDGAAEEATQAEAVQEAFVASLRRNVELHDILEQLSRAGKSVNLVPVSAHGLVKGFFESNWHPAWDKPLMLPDGSGVLSELLKGHPRSAALRAEFAELWMPLFVADAFVLAAFREKHALFVPFADASTRVRGIGSRRAA